MIKVQVANLEKYQPGYKDRKHRWAKIYFESFLDPAIQSLAEIDRYRFWSLIVLETFLEGKSLFLTDENIKLMGWNAQKRRIPLTLQMLHTLKLICYSESELYDTQSRVEESRVEESRGEKSRGESVTFIPPTLEQIKSYICEKGYVVDAQKFFDYFETSGWVNSGGKKVRNWKQKIITWSGGQKKELTLQPKLKTECSVCGKRATAVAGDKAYCSAECRKKELGW